MSEVLKCVIFLLVLVLRDSWGNEPTVNCRYRSNHLRQDGGLCFELPPWQHQPVLLDEHINLLRDRWGNSTSRRRKPQLALSNSEITRYMDTVIAPFLDTYHRNIQTSYQQMTAKILKRIKDEINEAVLKKQEIYAELTDLADKLNIPPMCDEERRQTRSIASKHVASVYACTEQARESIAKMGKYAEEMITITKKHMQTCLDDAGRMFSVDQNPRAMDKSEVHSCIKELSKSAVALGYELDLSLTNARRHNEQSCERLTGCSGRARKNTDEDVQGLREFLYQCVYA